VALRRRGVEVWILIASIVLISITAMLTYGNQRFREPADVALVVLAAVGLAVLSRRRPTRGAARPGGGSRRVETSA
jgi:hypothetical protein